MRAATAAIGGYGSIQTTVESLPLPSQTSAAADLVTKATLVRVIGLGLGLGLG